MSAPTCQVLFFGPAREAAGCGGLRLEISPGQTVGTLWERLRTEVPALQNLAGVRLARNQIYSANDDPVHPGDELAVLPPVSGG